MTTVVIGGGAAGFFAAIKAAEYGPVILFEKTNQLLSKVKISGGGRCNVTHACFDPRKLIENYPRGSKELLSCFMRFQPKDTIEWFESRGVPLKAEEDGRMFPTTDSSSSIISCLMSEAKGKGVQIRLQSRIESIQIGFEIKLTSGEIILAEKVILATGSSPQGYAFAQSFGHQVISPVPSLFTFNIPDSPLLELSGISLEKVKVKVLDFTFEGPLLLTHWGFSGPAVLKLSAFAARPLHSRDYQAEVIITWAESIDLIPLKKAHATKTIGSLNPYRLPKQLWKKFLEILSIDPEKQMAHLPNEQINSIALKIEKDSYQINGKTTYKEEFVTAGGVNLKEIHFKTMESKIVPGLHFAGEILDIDGITGGFNFQNAWTTGWIAGTR